MAKVPFTKLYTKEDLGKINTFEWMGEIIEVKQYLPIEEKLQILEMIINNCLKEDLIINPLEVSSNLETLLVIYYTNISFTETQKDKNALKTYNILREIGLIDKIKQYIPEQELRFLEESVNKIIDSMIRHLTSLPTIIENIIAKGKNSEIDLNKVKDEILQNEDVMNLVNLFMKENVSDKIE